MTFHCLRIQPSPGIHLRSQRRTYFQCTIHTYISVKVHLIKITETKTKEVAVVGKGTTVVYAESGRKQLLKCVSVGKISQGQPKSKKMWWLHHICYPAKYDGSRSSHRHTEIEKSKSRSMCL